MHAPGSGAQTLPVPSRQDSWKPFVAASAHDNNNKKKKNSYYVVIIIIIIIVIVNIIILLAHSVGPRWCASPPPNAARGDEHVTRSKPIGANTTRVAR